MISYHRGADVALARFDGTIWVLIIFGAVIRAMMVLYFSIASVVILVEVVAEPNDLPLHVERWWRARTPSALTPRQAAAINRLSIFFLTLLQKVLRPLREMALSMEELLHVELLLSKFLLHSSHGASPFRRCCIVRSQFCLCCHEALYVYLWDLYELYVRLLSVWEAPRVLLLFGWPYGWTWVEADVIGGMLISACCVGFQGVLGTLSLALINCLVHWHEAPSRLDLHGTASASRHIVRVDSSRASRWDLNAQLMLTLLINKRTILTASHPLELFMILRA